MRRARTAEIVPRDPSVEPYGGRFHLLMALFLLPLVAADAALAAVTQLQGAFEAIARAFVAAAALGVLQCYARRRGFSRIKDVCALAAWAAIATNALTVLVQVAGRSSVALTDAALERVDAALNFSTASAATWVAHFPLLSYPLSLMYHAVLPLSLAAVIAPTLHGHPKDSQRYLLAVTIGGIITAAVFAVYPAVGPWTVSNLAPSDEQAAVQRYLVSVLKGAGPARIELSSSGIISFPSFRAVLAVQAVIALWSLRPVRLPVLVLAVGICISTITTGWHYLIDVIGGIAVAGASYALARGTLAELCSSAPRRTPTFFLPPVLLATASAGVSAATASLFILPSL